MINHSTHVKPFLKWPGGKRWLVPHLLRLVDGSEYGTYFEPFLGGGAFFFALRPTNAMLSDLNGDLINTYTQVKNRPGEIVRRLKDMTVDRQTYYQARAIKPTLRLDRALRFLYLNRTAFGGIYRLNRLGRFNVPFGGGQRTPEPLWKKDLLRLASRQLRKATLKTGDFEDILQEARANDLVYCDPTYTVAHSDNGFVRYNESNFRWEDQKRLAAVCTALRDRGCTVLVSNASHRSVRNLFAPDEVHIFSRSSAVCPKPDKRRTVKEYVFVFRP